MRHEGAQATGEARSRDNSPHSGCDPRSSRAVVGREKLLTMMMANYQRVGGGGAWGSPQQYRPWGWPGLLVLSWGTLLVAGVWQIRRVTASFGFASRNRPTEASTDSEGRTLPQ